MAKKWRRQIDEEVKRIITIAYGQAKKLLTLSRAQLEAVANRLIVAESLSQEELAELLKSSTLNSEPMPVAILA